MEGYFYKYITEYNDDYQYMFLKKETIDYSCYYLNIIPDHIKNELKNQKLSNLHIIKDDQLNSMEIMDDIKFKILKNSYGMIIVIDSISADIYKDYTDI